MAETISFGTRPAGPAVGIYIDVDPSTGVLGLKAVKPLSSRPVPREFFLPDDWPEGSAIEGFWYELRAGRTVLYRATAPDPLDPQAEAVGADSFTHVDRAAPARKFRVVVPRAHAERADALVVYSSALARKLGRTPAQPIDTINGPFR